MGKALFISIALCLAFKIFTVKGAAKLPYYFFGILFFPAAINIIPNPSTTFPRFIVYALLLTTLIKYDNIYLRFKGFPFKNALVIIFIGLFIIGLADSRLSLYLKFYRPFLYALDNFIPFFLVFFYIKSNNDIINLFDKLIIFFFIMGIYGVMNLITGRVEYFHFISQVYDVFDAANLNTSASRSRFRISSFTNNPIYYGFIVSVMLLIMTFMFTSIRKLKRRNFYIATFFLLLINLLLANSRTPIISFIAGVAIFFGFGLNSMKKIRMVFFAIFFLVVGVAVAPSSFKIVDATINTFTSDDSGIKGGSSIEMRKAQLAASMLIFYEKPVFGHGLKYIVEGLGYSGDSEESKSNKVLKGFESYIYALLIEQGLVGIVSNLIFFAACIGWLWKRKPKSNALGKNYALISIGLFLSFLLFILGTGALGSFTFFLSIMGILIKAVLLNSNTNTTVLNNKS